jgi:hypothetical protein
VDPGPRRLGHRRRPPETGRPHEVFGAESEIIRVQAAAARAWYAELKRYGLTWSDPEDRE